MGFSAQEYRAAAKVIREDLKAAFRSGEIADEMDEKAAKVEARETYAITLMGMRIPSANDLYNGARLLDRLMNDGWTPPEGLF